MLLSKANLSVVSIASKDSFDRALNGVRIDPDGATVGSNGKMIMAVGPCDKEDKTVSFPETVGEQMNPGDRGLVMPLDVIERTQKYMTKGKSSLLNHVAMTKVDDPARIGFTSINQKGDPTTTASLPKHETYPDWKNVVRKINGSDEKDSTSLKVCVNRKDLIELLKALESACPNKADANPVFIEVSQNSGGMILRCLNHDTQQHAIGAINAYNTKGQWLQHDNWEREVFEIQVAKKKKKKKKKRRS